MTLKRKIKKFYMKPYKQFMFHFEYPNPSIDARKITKVEMEWCEDRMKFLLENRGRGWLVYNSHDYKIITKMYNMLLPQYLI